MKISTTPRCIQVLLLAFLSLMTFSASHAQQFKWVRSATNPGDYSGEHYGKDIVSGYQGNTYATGSFYWRAKFGNDLLSSGEFTFFIAAYDSAGEVTWARKGHPLNGEASGESIATDTLGNIYVTGYFTGSLEIDHITLHSAGSWDIFVAKYTNEGSLIWANAYGGLGQDKGNDIIVTPNGKNIYITGFFGDTGYFGSKAILSRGSQDAFLLKCNSSGNTVWVKNAGGFLHDEGTALTLDATGKIYLTGNYRGEAQFEDTTLKEQGYPNPGFNSWGDIFIVKYNPSGAFYFAVRAGGNSTDISQGIAFNNTDGKLYITGSFQDTAYFGARKVISQGGLDIFLAKYTISGTPLWVRRAGGPDDDTGQGLAISETGNILATGYFTAQSDFGNSTIRGIGMHDLFIANYNTAGIVQHVEKAGPSYTTGAEENIVSALSYAIATDSSGHAYITGYFTVNSRFGDTLVQSSAYSSQQFVAALRTENNAGPASLLKQVSHSSEEHRFILTASQDNHDLYIYEGEPASLYILMTDLSGRIVGEKQLEGTSATTIDISNQPQGIYLVKIFKNNIPFKTKMIMIR